MKGKGGIEGTLTKQYAIKTVKFSECKASVSEDPIYFYEDKEYTPEFTVRDGDRVLTEGKDFTVSYTNNIKLGTATVTVRGIGKYTGVLSVKFRSEAATDEKNDDDSKGDTGNTGDTGNKGDGKKEVKIRDCQIEIKAENLIYDGTEKKPEVIVSDNGKTLAEGQDYSLIYDNNTYAGIVTVYINGRGIYTGSVLKVF